MKSTRRRWWLLLVAGEIAGCRPTVVVSVAPWFRVEVTRPGYLPGRMIAFGRQQEVAKIRNDGHWKTVADGLQITTWPLGGGRAVALRHDGGPLAVYVEGSAETVVIPFESCPIPEASADGEKLLCARCAESRGPSMLQCREMALREFDARGQPRRDWHQAMPEAVRGPCLWPPLIAGIDDQGTAYLEGSCDPGPVDALPRTWELLELSPSNPRLFTQPAEAMQGDHLLAWSRVTGVPIHATNRGKAANAF
jgi:hypothetical protein